MKVGIGWRLLVAGTLAVFGLIVVTVFGFVLATPGIFAISLLLILLGIYAVWLVFTGTQKRLVIGWLLLIASSSVLVYTMWRLKQNDDFFVIRIIILSIVYSVLVSILRSQYWRQKRQQALKQKCASSFRRPVLIINPKSGNGRALRANIPNKAERLGIKVIITKKNDNIEGLAQQAVADGADVLGVSGGDGTLGAVAKVAIENKLPLAVLPGGTRCHFARDVGLEPKKIADALESFAGVERKIDVGSINGRIFLNNASFGLYADVVDNSEYRDHKLRTIRAVLRDILSGVKPYYQLFFTDNNKKKHRKAVQILVGVNAYDTMNALELGRRHRMNEGILQVTALSQLNDELIAKMMKTAVFSRDFEGEKLQQWKTKHFQVSSQDSKLMVGVDGEREKYDTPVTIDILPGALRLMVPPEGIRQRPARAFSPKVLKQLWRTLFTH